MIVSRRCVRSRAGEEDDKGEKSTRTRAGRRGPPRIRMRRDARRETGERRARGGVGEGSAWAWIDVDGL